MTHTKEPWQTAAPDDEFDTWLIMCSGPHDVANLSQRWRDGQRRRDIEEANARRIVACVNRLAAFKTEDIETPSFESGMYGVLERVTQQRDELLAALEKLAEVYDAMGAPNGPSRIIADAAIKKVRP